MAKYLQSTQGLEEALTGPMRRMTGRLVISARVGGQATRGSVWRGGKNSKRKVSVNTDAGTNVIKIRYHAKHGRNVVFLSAAEEREGLALWTEATQALAHGEALSFSVLVRAGHRVAERQIEAIKDHIKEGKRARGRVKPNLQSTEDQKFRETRKRDLPVLYRTGQMQEALLAEVKRL